MKIQQNFAAIDEVLLLVLLPFYYGAATRCVQQPALQMAVTDVGSATANLCYELCQFQSSLQVAAQRVHVYTCVPTAL